MSDTPETDSRSVWGKQRPYGLVVDADFTRKLERERDAAREALREAATLIGKRTRPDFIDKILNP